MDDRRLSFREAVAVARAVESAAWLHEILRQAGPIPCRSYGAFRDGHEQGRSAEDGPVPAVAIT